MNRALLALAALAAATPGVAQVPASADASLLPDYVVMRPGLIGAGQPTAEGLRQLKAQGFRTVINLRAAGEDGPAEEKAVVEGQGLRYYSIPLTAATFSAADVSAVKAALDTAAAGPVLLHCRSANRVGAVWAVLQAREGKPIDEALAEGQRVGLKSGAMLEAARRVAAEPAAKP